MSEFPRNFLKRIVGILPMLLVIVLLWAAFGQKLLTRPLWMDEIHSWLLISDPDVGHAMSALADGADYNPPTYYLVARTIRLFGPVTEYRLRLLSLLFTIGTALAVYLMLSRRHSAMVSAGATFFFSSHQLFVLQSTEARFYALWLCLLMWYCWLLTKDTCGGLRKGTQIATLGVLAAAVCTTHYFGIISVGLVTVAWAIANRRCRSSVLLSAGLLVCCVGVVALCLPMLKGQKAALTCATWVKPPTIASSTDYFLQFIPMLPLGLCAGAAFAGWISRQQPVPTGGTAIPEVRHNAARWSIENTVLVGSLLMPIVLIVFSWVVQPALVNRYAIVAVVGVVPIYAWLLSRATESIQNFCAVLGAVLLGVSVHHGSETWEYNLQKQFVIRDGLSELPTNQVIVFEDRIDYWLLKHLQPEHETTSWYQVDFESQDLVRPSNLRTVQRDVGRRTQKWYPQRFPMKSITRLNELTEFIVVPYFDKPFGEVRFPSDYKAERINDRMYRLTKSSIRSAQRSMSVVE